MQVMESDVGSPVECPGCHKHVIVQQGSSQAIPVQGASPTSAPPPPPPPPGVETQTIPSRPPTQVQYATQVEPHRGTLILVFGILGLVVCMPFGIAAWVMANTDLQSMEAGRMDRTGEGLTKAGKILGIISVVILIVGIVGFGCLGSIGAFVEMFD
jgi:hypothetical protein